MDTVEPATTRLLVDVGQTGSRIEDPHGERHTRDQGYTPGVRLDDLVGELLASLDNPVAETVVLSLTGLRGVVPDITQLAQVCRAATGARTVGVCDDGLAWSVGSLAGDDGIALAVGGGVVAVARRGDHYVHADGNGSDFGDSGGAYWLGRKGIRRAIRAIEGSAEATSLAEAFSQAFGRHEDFVLQYTGREEVHRVCIEFSRAVLTAAHAGDEAAVQILDQGAERLAAVVLSALHSVGLTEAGTPVALGGGLMKDELYRSNVESRINPAGPHYSVREPRGDALDGLSLLERSGRKGIENLMKWWMA